MAPVLDRGCPPAGSQGLLPARASAGARQWGGQTLSRGPVVQPGGVSASPPAPRRAAPRRPGPPPSFHAHCRVCCDVLCVIPGERGAGVTHENTCVCPHPRVGVVLGVFPVDGTVPPSRLTLLSSSWGVHWVRPRPLASCGAGGTSDLSPGLSTGPRTVGPLSSACGRAQVGGRAGQGAPGGRGPGRRHRVLRGPLQAARPGRLPLPPARPARGGAYLT